MKVVINNCYGGFSLSAKALHRLCALQKKPCYFYKHIWEKRAACEYVPIEGYPEEYTNWIASSANKPEDIDWETNVHDTRPKNRHDPFLVQVVEEMGKEANGPCATLKVVDIPDGVDYIVQEYDGNEWIAENHRTWS